MKKYILLLIIPFLTWGQCQDENACNFNENEPCEFFSCFECDYLLTVPDTYEFFRNDESTVYYNGQTCRLQMAEDIYDALNDESYTAEQVLEMFNEGTGFPNEYDCGKNIGNRTAQTSEFPEYIKLQFDQMIEEYFSEVVPNFNNPASVGVSGEIFEECGGNYGYKVNGKGLEIDQVFIKGLMGAMVIDQINNKYLNRVLNNESSNDTNELNPLGYTDMEHDLDEAFGFLYGYNNYHVGGNNNNADSPAEGYGLLVNKYLYKINDDNNCYGIAGAIYHAFVIARHAIVTNNYVERDFQINVIKSLLNKVIINRALHYLIYSAETIESGCPVSDTFHDLSQAYGFILALQFTDYFDTNQVENILNQMIDGNGLWDITVSEINDIIEFLTINSGFDYYENIQYQFSVSEAITEYCDCSDDNEALSALGGCEAAITIFEDLGGCDYVFNGTLISDICQESCGECNSTHLDEGFINKKLLYSIDLIGKICNTNSCRLNIYDDGSVQKKYVIE